MFNYNPVRDSSSSITTLLPISNGNNNGSISNYTNHNEDSITNLNSNSNIADTTLPKNKDPTSDGNIIITINDFDKLKISYIDIRLNSLYKNMILIEQQENILNNNNNVVNISGKVVISVLKPLLLYKPITLEMKGNFKLDFIEINKNNNKHKKNKKNGNSFEENDDDDDDRMDTVVVKESRPIFYAKWDNLIDKSDGEYTDLCKNKFERERNMRFNSNNKRKLKTPGNIKNFKGSSLTNMLKKAALITQNSYNKDSDSDNNEIRSNSSDGLPKLSPVNTHDNVFTNSHSEGSNLSGLNRPPLTSSSSTSSINSQGRHKKTRQRVKVLNPDNPLSHKDENNIENGLNDDDIDSDEITKIYMPAGNYEFPFRLTVDEKDLPDTIEGLQTGSLFYTLTMKMYCENYGLVEHVQYVRVFKTLKANNLNLHTGFKFKHDLKVKKKTKKKQEEIKNDENTEENSDSNNKDTTAKIEKEETKLVTQLQINLETPSKACPLGGSIPLKFQLTPLIKNFEIVKIDIRLNQKSILWDNNNEKYEKNALIREWSRDVFDNISGIEKFSSSPPKYKLVDSDIEFLFILPIPNNLKEITQNSIVPEHFYNGSINDEEYNEYKVLQLPRISNSHSLSVDIFIKQPSGKIDKEPLKFSFQLPLILFCSPNVGVQMRKVLLDKFKRIHFRKGEVEKYFPDPIVKSSKNKSLPNNKDRSSASGNNSNEDNSNRKETSNSNDGQSSRELMNSFVQRWFPQLQAQNPPPLYDDFHADDLIESSNSISRLDDQGINETIAAKKKAKKEDDNNNNNTIIKEVSKDPPTYSNTHFDDRNTAISVDHYKILKSERLIRQYFDRLLLGRQDTTDSNGNENRNQENTDGEFDQGVLQFESVAPEYNNYI